jgi:hypothetical protein
MTQNEIKNEFSTQKLSFWNLISSDLHVQIPIIQRDYAQGRNDDKTKRIRGLFLRKIKEVLEHPNGSMELDFVYGDIAENKFKPLDGQQRLTTLFLLHWFIAHKTEKLKQHKNEFLKFSYETRISSREFCYNLAENGNDLGLGLTISEKIQDSKWFFQSWRKDPTIKSMLVTLNHIEKEFEKNSTDELNLFWLRLTEDESITFLFRSLDNVGLTDDLYIKMNARGKALTDFENFKARFEKYIKVQKFEDATATKEDLEIVIQDSFSFKIDTIWTDLFWCYRDEKNKIDGKLMKFMTGIAINNYALSGQIYEDIDEENEVLLDLKKKNSKNTNTTAIKRERIERRILTLFNNPYELKPEDFPTKESFIYLCTCFDVYSRKSNDKLIPTNLSMWDLLLIHDEQNETNNLFSQFISGSKTEYKQRALFLAQTAYLLSVEEFNEESFSDWMRVIRNIVQNSTIDSAATFIGSIGLIKELVPGCGNIYEFLKNIEVKSNFAQAQFKEEKLKSFAISLLPDCKYLIFDLEDTFFFKGKIEFALHTTDFTQTSTELYLGKLSSILEIVNLHLGQRELTNTFRRGLLTCGDNNFYDYWTSWSYNTDSHKRCFLENVIELKNNLGNGFIRENLKELFLKLMHQNLEDVISNYVIPSGMPSWKKRIIQEPELLNNHCQGHYFGILNDNSACLLYYWKKRPNSREECYRVE